MNLENRAYQVLLLVGTFAAAIAPTWVAVEIFKKQTPPKAIEVITTFANPSDSLGSLREKINLSLSIGKKTYKNLTVATVQIKNKGTSPIIDSDIKAPLSATISKGWEIVAIGEYEIPGRPTPTIIKWEKSSDSTMVAGAPFLLNQNESATFPVYLSRTAPDSTTSPPLSFSWTARIVGLTDVKSTEYGTPLVYYNPTPADSFNLLIVGFTFRDVLFFYLIAFPILWLYFHLILKKDFRQTTQPITMLWLIAACLITVAVAEVSTSYLNRSALQIVDGYEWIQTLNLAIVVAGGLFALLLLYRSRGGNAVGEPADSKVG